MRRALVLMLLYVSTHMLTPLSNFDYIIVYYMLLLPNVRLMRFLGYSFLFGLTYDLQYHVLLGVGVLMFLGLSVIKIVAYQAFDMTKVYTDMLFRAGLLLAYTCISMLFFGYSGDDYWATVLHYFALNLAAFAAVLVLSKVLAATLRAVRPRRLMRTK